MYITTNPGDIHLWKVVIWVSWVCIYSTCLLRLYLCCQRLYSYSLLLLTGTNTHIIPGFQEEIASYLRGAGCSRQCGAGNGFSNAAIQRRFQRGDRDVHYSLSILPGCCCRFSLCLFYPGFGFFAAQNL